MNTIEQAAKRLEQLRRAGVDVVDAASMTSALPAVEPATSPAPLPAPAASPQPQAGATQLVPSMMAGQTPQEPFALDTAPSRLSKSVDLDLLRMQRAGLLIPGQPRSQLEEEIRIIKRPLLDNASGHAAARPHRANLIMVTSAVPGEGKTQTAINLATSMAMEMDHTVLLVEADVLRPSALERMGVQASKGLLDLLTHPEMDLSDVLLRTNIPKLTLLPAGTGSARSTELLASTALDELLEELASKYADRIIVFDSPPLLSTTESRVLASRMGQVVMVVESGRTPIPTVKQAFATVEDHPVVLPLLNKYRGPKSGSAYGYYAP